MDVFDLTVHYLAMRALCGFVVTIMGFGCAPAPAPQPQMPPAQPAPVDVVLPVAASHVIGSRELHPAAIVFVDDAGALALGHTGKQWDGTLPKARKPVGNPLAIKREILTAMIEDGGPVADDARVQLSGAQDDPPPPEEEDKPDDGEDESGGTGTAMVLEEGRMGKKDSDRAEGAYKMQKDPQLARQDAIEQARAAGILAARGTGHTTVFEGFAAEHLTPFTPLIAATPKAPASMIVQVIEVAGSGALAVQHTGALRVLATAFARSRYNDFSGYGVVRFGAWMEIHLEPGGIQVLEAGRPATAVAWQDRAAFATALEKTRVNERFTGTNPAIDILVAANGVTAQQLIDTIVAVADSGSHVSIGRLPESSVERVSKLVKARHDATPTVALGQPNAQGDLDKAIIRRYIKRNITKIQNCYEKELVAKPAIKGTVQVSFFIEPSGKVRSSTASGVDPDVATCVAAVIKAIEFPKPKGGGGVQVNYPFTFRPLDD